LAILLTLVVEIPILIIFGFRKRDIVTVGILINIATNFSINLLMRQIKYVIDPAHYGWWILPPEAAVVIIEFTAMSFFTEKKLKLFLVVMLANAVSYLAGVIIWGSY